VREKRAQAVTGAYGFSGKYIARRLLDQGLRVITLTNSINRPNPFGDRVKAHPFHFHETEKLKENLESVEVLYNTYWVRFNSRDFSFASALENSQALFDAARKAGVERIVHISITNPSLDSPLEYFSGKARLEKAIKESGLSYAILRPALLFGRECILVNNIAWFLRRFPVFTVFGDGKYGIRPIYVDDLAALAVARGQNRKDEVINAVGPETFSYRELVNEVGRAIRNERPVLSVPPFVGYAFAKIVGLMLGDVITTWDEIRGLMAGLLYVDSPPTGSTKLTDWVRAHDHIVGRRYANELSRRRDRQKAYVT
jgi:nucleoside-diphosphate-sugar epimerase